MRDDGSDLGNENEVKLQTTKDTQQLSRVKSRTSRNSNHPIMHHSISGKYKDKCDPGAISTIAIKNKMYDVGLDASFIIKNCTESKRIKYLIIKSLNLLGNDVGGYEGKSLQ